MADYCMKMVPIVPLRPVTGNGGAYPLRATEGVGDDPPTGVQLSESEVLGARIIVPTLVGSRMF